jgi:N-dimethylarginine dimethylaminohydrolase
MADGFEQARNIAAEVLSLTRALTLTGEPELAEAEVSAFAELMDKREPLIEKMLEAKKSAGGGDAALDKIITEIINMDRAHRKTIDHIQNHLRSSIKEIKSGQRLSDVYVHPMDNQVSLLDAKQ